MTLPMPCRKGPVNNDLKMGYQYHAGKGQVNNDLKMGELNEKGVDMASCNPTK